MVAEQAQPRRMTTSSGPPRRAIDGYRPDVHSAPGAGAATDPESLTAISARLGLLLLAMEADPTHPRRVEATAEHAATVTRYEARARWSGPR